MKGNTEIPIQYPNQNANVNDGRGLNETVEVDRDPPLPRSFSFLVGDFTKVKEQCLSITYTFGENNQISVRHPSYLPLLHGLCTLHSLGISSYVCQYCAAQLWKSETVNSRNGTIGKHCCSNGKVHLLPLQHLPHILSELLCGIDNESKIFLLSSPYNTRVT